MITNRTTNLIRTAMKLNVKRKIEPIIWSPKFQWCLYLMIVPVSIAKPTRSLRRFSVRYLNGNEKIKKIMNSLREGFNLAANFWILVVGFGLSFKETKVERTACIPPTTENMSRAWMNLIKWIKNDYWIWYPFRAYFSWFLMS